MSTTIKYKGETVTSIEGGQTATLHLTGKKLTDDLVIEASGGSTLPTYNGEYISLGAPKEATVTITNTSGSYDAEVTIDGKRNYVFANAVETFVVPIGSEINLTCDDSAIIPSWNTTSISGEYEIITDNNWKIYRINGDCTIVGYAYDAD